MEEEMGIWSPLHSGGVAGGGNLAGNNRATESISKYLQHSMCFHPSHFHLDKISPQATLFIIRVHSLLQSFRHLIPIFSENTYIT
jgi:hypothetical protein